MLSAATNSDCIAGSLKTTTKKDLENGTWVWLRIPGVTPYIWDEMESLSQDNSATYGYEKVLSRFPLTISMIVIIYWHFFSLDNGKKLS